MSLARVVFTTINKYIKGETNNVMRKRAFLAMLEAKKRVSYGRKNSGQQLDWKVRDQRAGLTAISDGDTMTFPQRNRWITAQLPWRGYGLADAITKFERLKNRGAEAIIDVYERLVDINMEDFRDAFAEKLFNIDGNAAATNTEVHGLESIFSASSYTSGIGTNDDTYAGINTALADQGGTWTGTWPQGYGDAVYDFWTPLTLDYNDAAWTGTATWASAGQVVLRFMVTYAQRNAGELDVIFLERTLYNDFLNAVDANERIMVQRAPADSTLVKLGFKNVVNQDGVDVTWDHGIAANVGYGLTLTGKENGIELCSMQDQLIVAEQDNDLGSFSDRFRLDFYGNLKINPRGQSKLLSD